MCPRKICHWSGLAKRSPSKRRPSMPARPEPLLLWVH